MGLLGPKQQQRKDRTAGERVVRLGHEADMRCAKFG